MIRVNPTNKTTVTFVTVLDPTSVSGGGVATKEIIKAFCTHASMEVSLICPRPVESLPTAITEEAVDIRHLPERTAPGSLTYHGREEAALFQHIIQSIRVDDPDLIVSRLAPSLVVPPILASAFDIPYVPLTRGRLGLERGRRHRKWTSLVEWVYRLNYAVGERTYVPVADFEEEIRTISSSIPIHVFPNAVDPELFEPISVERARDGLDLCLGESDIVVGFVGSLGERHRMTELIHGFEQAFGTDPTARLLIVGGDDEGINRLRQVAMDAGITDRIEFTGSVTHSQVPVHIAACDVMYGVSDPDFPTTPIKLFEYLACERPVITTDQPDLAFVGEHNLGYVLATPTAEAVAGAIKSFAAMDRSERLTMGKDGRQYVVNHHTWDRLPELVLEHLGIEE